jgi:hypothetical protein
MTTHRILNRRTDPLRRRTLDDWRRAFARFRVITPALICASRKVAWDYPGVRSVTDSFSEGYHSLVRLPPKNDIVRCLVRLGYHPIQAERAVIAWGQACQSRNAVEVNAYGRHLQTLIAPAYREDNDGSVSVNLSLDSKNPGNS